MSRRCVPRRASIVLALVASAAVALAPAASALTPADVPNPRTARGSWVSDVAGVLSPQAEQSIDAIANDLRQSTGAEIAVVTVPETGEQSTKEFATALFKLWGVGDRERDDGVLVVIDTQAHRIEVETGYGAEAVLPDGRVGRILDTYVIPLYRAGDWDGGTVAGVREMAHALARPDSTSGPEPGQQPAWKATGSSPTWDLWQLAVGLAVLIATAVTAMRFSESWPRGCPRCRRRMRLLTREQETAYLSAEEAFEEALRSMNHIVWRCDDCQLCHIEHRRRWVTAYVGCPRCRRCTLKTTSLTLVAATYQHAGSREVRRQCELKTCRFGETRRESIPRLERVASSGGDWSGGGGGSSHSGGGSFGGGSSGGGGAGRSW